VIALVRTEMVKAAQRIRTLVIVGGLAGLPLLISFALHAHRGERGDRGEGLFLLARQSGLLVPAAVLSVTSAFLLIVVSGVFAGDSVAGDAGWGNLRYLLMRPVRRGRLLVAKAFVAATLIWFCTFLVATAALVGGVMQFGSHPLTVPTVAGSFLHDSGGFTLGTRTLLERSAIVTAYVAFGYTALLAIGTFFSTLTDSAAGAIGATIGVYIVSEILDAIPAIGRIRYAFPTHYLEAWHPMFTENRFPRDMAVGVAVQLGYLCVFGAAALIWFRRKDIRS
jgi:ABC-2 type transport system permease protein